MWSTLLQHETWIIRKETAGDAPVLTGNTCFHVKVLSSATTAVAYETNVTTWLTFKYKNGSIILVQGWYSGSNFTSYSEGICSDG